LNIFLQLLGNSWGIHPGGNRNTWDDGSSMGNVHGQNWEDKSHLGGGGIGTPWNSEGPNAGPLWNKNKPSWPDNDITNDWPNQNKLSNTSSEIIRSSKPFRILAESGFKKDDVELALRNTNMNLDEAMELLQQQRNAGGIEPWHQQPNPGGFDHSPFPGNRYPGPQMPFPPNNPNKMPNANAGGPAANMGLNNIPMPFNKHLPHQAGAPAAFPQSAAASQSGQPSAHHLRNLVQQIQKAVQAGYLNHQILNQPLAPQTLQLLNSLLNAIQQLQSTQQSIQRNGGVNSIQLQMTIQNQKKQISALQTQISQQQALYIKSQVGGNSGGGIGSGDFLRQNSSGMGMGVGNHNDPIASLENNLSNLGLKNEASPYTSNTTSQQSRLNQWKLPSAIDNKATDPDFSRAPGTTSSKQSLPPTTPTSISSIGIHNEPSTWSSGRNDGGWPDSNIDTENKDWPSSNQSPAFTDLVPEFQPGKPWKVNENTLQCLINAKKYTFLGHTKEHRR
jgi:trinucleotide repeat-containing gene 6 protein